MKKLLIGTSLVLALGLLVMSCTDSTAPTQQNSASGSDENANGGEQALQSDASQTGGNGPSDAGFIEANGSFIDCAFNSLVKEVGPNLIITEDLTQTMYGTLDGCWTGSERDVVFLRTGSATFHGSGTFDGIVEGHSGSIVMSYEGTFDPQTNLATAHWILKNGTDGLKQLHGEGTWSGTFIDPEETPCTGDPAGCEAMFGATYSGTLHFTP